MHNLNVYSSIESLNKAICQHVVDLSIKAQEASRPFNVALSGGKTPQRLYKLFASQPFVEQISWGGFNVFFGDERTVPPDSDESNYHMAKLSLFDRSPIPSENIHRVEGENADPSAAAAAYATVLTDFLPTSEEGIPTFDVILLGLGDDGHIASLFPDTPILSQTQKWVDAVYVEKLQTWRISLTFPVINQAKNIFLIVAGEGKAEIVSNVLGSSTKEAKYPVQRLQPKGQVLWFLDSEAASRLANVEK